MTDTFTTGNLVRCRGAFTTRALTAAELADFRTDGTLPAGVGTDPTTVSFDYRVSGGATSTDAYPANIVKQATGSYYRDLDTNTDGEWEFRFYSTGTGQAAADHAYLAKSRF